MKFKPEVEKAYAALPAEAQKALQALILDIQARGE